MERVKEILDAYADAAAKCNMMIDMNVNPLMNEDASSLLFTCLQNTKTVHEKCLQKDYSEDHISHICMAIETNRLFVTCLYEKNKQGVSRP